jgi:hypothetical protein
MRISMPTVCSFLKTSFVSLLGLALFSATSAAKVEIAAVDVGIEGTYKLGKWTPIRVTLQSDAPTMGSLKIATTDGEGVACNYVVDELTIEAGTTTVNRVVRLGRNRQVTVRLVDAGGETTEFVQALDQSPITAWQQWVLTVGSDIAIEKALRLRQRPATEAIIGTHVEDCANLPTTWLGYDGVDVIFLTTGDAGLRDRISNDQYSAMTGWVAKGGRMVICTATHAEAWMGQGGPLELFAPGPLNEIVRQRQTSGLETFADTSQRLDTLMQDAAGRIAGLPTAVFENREGFVDVEEGFGSERSSWLIRRPFGLGIVTILTADIDVHPISDWIPRPRLIARLIDSALPGQHDEMEETQSGQMTHVGYRDLTGQLRRAMEQFAGVKLFPFSLIAGMAAVYILLIGPLDFLLLRRFRRMELTWVTFPIIVAGTCLVAGLLANHWKGSEIRVNEIQMVDIDGSSGEYRGSMWTHVYTPRTQELAVSLLPQPEELIPGAVEEGTALAWQGLPGSGFGGMSGESQHGAFLQPYEVDLDQINGQISVGLRNLSMPKWSSRSLAGICYGTCSQPLDIGALRVNRDGLLEGQVRNPLTSSIRDAAICFGRWYYAIGELKSGDTFELQFATPKDFKTFLTKRTFVASFGAEAATRGSKELASPWDPESHDLGRIVQMIAFHDAAGGRSGYTGLLHRFEGNLDMSDLIKTNRAVLFGKVARGVCEVALDGNPHADSKGQRLSYCRIVIPVGRESDDSYAATAKTLGTKNID